MPRLMAQVINGHQNSFTSKIEQMPLKSALYSEFQPEKPYSHLEEINEAPSDHENSVKDQSPHTQKDYKH